MVTPSHPFLALDIHHRVAQFQGDAEVVQALHNVALQAAGIGHQLRHAEHLGPFQRHPAGHDQADIAGAQDHHPAPGQIPFHIHQPLGRACRIDAGGAVAGNVQRTAGPLPAAHGQHHRLGVQLEQAVLPVHGP